MKRIFAIRGVLAVLVLLVGVFIGGCATTSPSTPAGPPMEQPSLLYSNVPPFIVDSIPSVLGVGVKKIIDKKPEAKQYLREVAVCLDAAVKDSKLTYSDVFVVLQRFDYWKKYYGAEIEMIAQFIPVLNQPASVSPRDMEVFKKIAASLMVATE